MSAKHRLAVSPKSKRLRTERPARRGKPLFVQAFIVVSLSLLVAAGLAAVMVNAFGAGRSREATAEMFQELRQASQPAGQVSQEGTVIAVSARSVTARSADGYIQTYVVTPNTTVITRTGSRSRSTVPHFAVNDEVTILGTVQNGTVFVTAMAHRGMTHGDGPSMDYVEGRR